ncbi:hypothetical protein M569_13211, partial [Genlisea aurea]
FSPVDNYLIDCGSSRSSVLDDGRNFTSDPQSSPYLSSARQHSVIVSDDDDSVSSNNRTDELLLPSLMSPVSSLFLPLYLTARIFSSRSGYEFPIVRPGRHWLRLHFYPLRNKVYNLSSAAFGVKTDDFVLLTDFSVQGMVFKEYLINITADKLTLTFSPLKNSLAFVNGIELVSAPDNLIPDDAVASVIPFGGDFVGLSHRAIEVMFRLNVGGPMVSPENDTLSRFWLNDSPFMAFPQGAANVSVPSDVILYGGGGVTPLIAPYSVYSTADQMADSDTMNPNFNLTWEMSVDPLYSYLIRLHFCDIVSRSLDELYFNVYVNGFIGVSSLDLSSVTSGLVVPYFKDFVLNASAVTGDAVMVQVGPSFEANAPNAILNGLEVMKLSNLDGSLDGGVWPHPSKTGLNPMIKALAVVGFVLGVVALVLLFVRLITRTRRRQQQQPKEGGYQKQNNAYSFSSWLNSTTSNRFSFVSSSRSKSWAFSSGRRFTLIELRNATGNFSEDAVVGVGGFGRVYLGVVESGVRVAIKRGNVSSSQGIDEFRNEIHLLSELRHRHLVSLVGYCDEQSEMILVYEYMANGSLSDHLYGSSRPRLSWKKRLEICIGAARGLHHLHTGSSTRGKIIHRDVKTSNILLDDAFVAKISDFGLSKAGPASRASTVVKGSFGYLDPEYFRRLQLTEKSDVYSFGVVLFEVLCGRPAIDARLPREEANLAEHAKKQHARGRIDTIVDPFIAGRSLEHNKDSVIQFVDGAVKCLAEYGVDRPSMVDVVWNLEYALQLLEMADKEKDVSD